MYWMGTFNFLFMLSPGKPSIFLLFILDILYHFVFKCSRTFYYYHSVRKVFQITWPITLEMYVYHVSLLSTLSLHISVLGGHLQFCKAVPDIWLLAFSFSILLFIYGVMMDDIVASFMSWLQLNLPCKLM